MTKCRRIIVVVFFSGLLVATALLVGNARMFGSDEASVYANVKILKDGGYSFRHFLDVTRPTGSVYYSHHLAWFLMMAAASFLLDVLGSLVPVLANPTIQNTLLSYLQVVTIFSAIVATYFYLKKRTGSQNGGLFFTGLIWGGSYSLSFLSGGWIENTMVLLVVIRLFVCDATRTHGARAPLWLALIDAGLIACKAYALPFCLLTLPVFGSFSDGVARKDFFKRYFGFFLVFIALWGGVKFWFYGGELAMYSDHTVSAIDTYSDHAAGSNDIFSPIRIIKNIWAQFFDLTYGLLWTFPLAFVSLIACQNLKVVAQKWIALTPIMLVLGVFPFWSGAPGVSGPRYIFPFLFFLIPEIVGSLVSVFRRRPKCVFAAPFLVLLFFPTLNYTPNVILESQFKLGKPYFHPPHVIALMAWRFQMAKVMGWETVSVTRSDGSPAVSETDAIVPRTAALRLFFLKDHKPSNAEEHYKIIAAWPSWIFQLIKFASFAILSLWSALFLRAALLCHRDIKSGVLP